MVVQDVYWSFRQVAFAELMVQAVMTVAPARVCVLMAGLSWVPWLVMHHRCAAPPSQSPISLTQARWGCKPAINNTHSTHTLHNYFFRYLSQLKCIDNDQRDICDKQITLEEVSSAIQQLKLNKSPGTDGLTSEFYKTFADNLAPFLHGVFTESIHNQTLPPTLNQGLLTLIHKPNNDPLHIDNWRPICLLNNDYKILAGIFAKGRAGPRHKRTKRLLGAPWGVYYEARLVG